MNRRRLTPALEALLKNPAAFRTTWERDVRNSTRVIPTQLHHGAWLARVLGDVPMFLSPVDISVSASLAFHGYWEYGPTRWWLQEVVGLCNVLDDAPVVWDVGANVGWFSLVAAHAGADVLSFEPQPDLIELQKMTRHINGISSWRMLGAALGDEKTDVCMEYPEGYENAGSARTMLASEVDARGSPSPFGAPRPRVHHALGMKLRKLQQVTARGLPVAPPSLVKMDVEGYEGKVLRGMSREQLEGVRSWLIEYTPGYDEEHDPHRILTELGCTAEALDGDGHEVEVGSLLEAGATFEMRVYRNEAARRD